VAVIGVCTTVPALALVLPAVKMTSGGTELEEVVWALAANRQASPTSRIEQVDFIG
jgi:hypothetical protein